jgi:hypothetical protein
MNAVDLIRNCIKDPYYTKDFLLEEENDDGDDGKSIVSEMSIMDTLSQRSNGTMSTLSTCSNVHHKKWERKLSCLFMKVWSSFVKIIRRQVLNGKIVVSHHIGYFFRIPQDNALNVSANNIKKEDEKSYAYIPKGEFIQKGRFQFKENKFNILTPPNV